MLLENLQIPQQGFYYHYKHSIVGKFNNYAYEVVGTGCHTEMDHEDPSSLFVVYRPLYKEAFVYKNGKMFDIRPLSMFTESVMVNGLIQPRFRKIDDTMIISMLTMVRDEMYNLANKNKKP